MPGLKALFITPVCQQPNLVLVVQGADDFETNKSRGSVYEVRAIDECIFHFRGGVVRDGELAQGYEHFIQLVGGSNFRNWGCEILTYESACT